MFKKKTIPLNNYLILLLIVLIVVLITIFTMKWINTLNDSQYVFSPLNDNVNKVYLNELPEALSETNQVVLYVGYTNDSKTQEMESRLLNIINEKDLKEYIIYVNIDEKLNKNEYLKTLKELFPNIKNQITGAPMFIYVKNGEGIEAYSSEIKLIDEEVFKSIIEKYEISN